MQILEYSGGNGNLRNTVGILKICIILLYVSYALITNVGSSYFRRIGGGWGGSHLLLLLKEAPSCCHPSCRPRGSRLWPSRQPGIALLISLASTLVGAGLFLEYFAEPGSVVSAGILMPIYFSKIPLDWGSGFGVF